MGRPRKRQRGDGAENSPSDPSPTNHNHFSIDLDDQPLPSFDEWAMPSFDVSQWSTRDFLTAPTSSGDYSGVPSWDNIGSFHTASSDGVDYVSAGLDPLPAEATPCNGTVNHPSPALSVYAL